MLSSEEQDLLWKFRFYLCSHKKALIKFLKCINWGTPDEAQQALHLLNKWAAMDVEDALELLGPTFKQREVRRYAIGRLAQAPDEDLLLYLLQLVQALKYENFDDIIESHNLMFPERMMAQSSTESSILLDQITSSNLSTANTIAPLTSSSISTANSFHIDGGHSFGASKALNVASKAPSECKNPEALSFNNQHYNLCMFLIHRACRNSTLANYLFWYLSIEIEEQASIRKQHENIHKMYAMVRKMFLKVLKNGNQMCYYN